MLKPKSFRGAAPWTPVGALPLDPPGALEWAPGILPVGHSARFSRSAFMDSKLLTLTRRTNTKFVPTGLAVSQNHRHLFEK